MMTQEKNTKLVLGKTTVATLVNNQIKSRKGEIRVFANTIDINGDGCTGGNAPKPTDLFMLLYTD